MAETHDPEDFGESDGIDVPELALGLSLIGLGAVLVFKALTRNRGKGHPMLPHRVPIDITSFTRQGNQISADVVLNGATDLKQSVTLQYLLVTGPATPPTPADRATARRVSGDDAADHERGGGQQRRTRSRSASAPRRPGRRS